MTTSYELYIMPGCPFCKKVTGYMDRMGIKIPLRNIVSDSDARDTLVRVGGKRQVPCLFIDGTPLYESDDIIRYMENNFH